LQEILKKKKTKKTFIDEKMRRLSRGRGLPAKGVLADGIPKAKANSTAVDTSFTRKLSWVKMLFLGRHN